MVTMTTPSRNQSPEQPRKMIVMIVTVCAVFGPKTEIACLHTKEMPDVAAICSVEAVGQVYKRMHGAVYYLGGMSTTKQAKLSIEVDWRIRNPWRSSASTPRIVQQPTERLPSSLGSIPNPNLNPSLELKIRMNAAEGGSPRDKILHNCRAACGVRPA